MYTEERLFTYLQQFERDFARSKAQIIDATEGGVLKRGATAMTFAEAIAQFARSRSRSQSPDHRGLNCDRLGECSASLHNRLDEADRNRAISRETMPLLEEIRDHSRRSDAREPRDLRIDVLALKDERLHACLSPHYATDAEYRAESLQRRSQDRRCKSRRHRKTAPPGAARHRQRAGRDGRRRSNFRN